MSLRPCPFCEATDVAMPKKNPRGKYDSFARKRTDGWYVVCEVCGGRTGVFTLIDEAKQSWGEVSVKKIE